MIADTHIHLSRRSFENTFPYLDFDGKDFFFHANGSRAILIEKLKEAEVAFCIEPGVELESNAEILALSRQYPGFIYPTVGIHPTRTFRYVTVDNHGRRTIKRLKLSDFPLVKKWAASPNVIAIGETGLDYHLAKEDQHRFIQTIWFIRQLLLAHRYKLPVILHIREADNDALRILRLFRKWLHGGVCHCFNGSTAMAKAYTKLGLMLGIGGSLLQNTEHCKDLEEAIRITPIEYILLETDGPYVNPVCPLLTGKQYRKARNTSLILPAVATRIAELKGMTVKDVRQITAENAARVFHIRMEEYTK